MQLTLLCLGVGAGSTTVVHGEPSTAFVILADGEPILLVDLGYGVARQALNLLGKVPHQVYISHNHSDHSGDLPVMAMQSWIERAQLRILSAPEVRRRLQAHRLHEFLEAGLSADVLAEWVDTPEGGFIPLNSDLALVTRQSQHSETCFGFVLFQKGQAVLAYSADSGFDEDYYQWLAQAPVLVLDARSKGSADHAGFEDVRAFVRLHPQKTIYVVHYGRLDDAPEDLEVLRPGQTVIL